MTSEDPKLPILERDMLPMTITDWHKPAAADIDDPLSSKTAPSRRPFLTGGDLATESSGAPPDPSPRITGHLLLHEVHPMEEGNSMFLEIGRASCRERV